MKKIVLLLGVLFMLVVLVVDQKKSGNLLKGKGLVKDGRVSIILTGFGEEIKDGGYSGEGAILFNSLNDRKNLSDKIGMCQNVFEGDIFGNRVVLATSGMAKVRTVSCLMDLLRYYNKKVKEVIVVGIAGITPRKGGMSDKPGNLSNSDLAMIGDVCINSLAYDFDLQHYSSDRANTKLANPVFWAQQSIFSSQYTTGSPDLARELYGASLSVAWPTVPEQAKTVNFLYHRTSRDAKVWGPDECLEATSDLYWHDIAADSRAREIGAAYMSQVSGKSILSSKIVVVTSMEALPAGVVVDLWNKNNSARVAFAYSRGASNFDQVYLDTYGIPGKDGRTSIEDLKKYGLGQYAIETASLPILKMFELRGGK